ncbi:MAG: GyrI-like domain-containing protein [Alphaproteobacteria bacterium]|nr:GyrI-like domain-containing protein [Alphaproteobacteria bacterium]
MNYRIEKKSAFTVLANSKIFNSATAQKEIPQFWTDHFQSGKGEYINGTFGICLDNQKEKNTFKYMIADFVEKERKAVEGLEFFTIPERTYAIFTCIGPVPETLQKMTNCIFSEWMKTQTEFKIDDKFTIEWYDHLEKYEKGLSDENYKSEIWIPVQSVP